MPRSPRPRGKTARELALVLLPLALSVLLCGAAVWLTLLSAPRSTAARESSSGLPLDRASSSGLPPDEGTAPDRDPGPRAFIAGETQ